MDVRRVVFSEDKENGVVIAKISNIAMDAINKINSNFIYTVTSKISIIPTCINQQTYLMPRTLKAVARCHPDDGASYNYEEGKKIALKKLTEKYERSMNKRIARFLVDMNQVCNRLDEYFKNRTF